MNHLFLRIGRLPDAKNPKKDMHASFDILMTVLKGHLVAAACTELGISGPDSDIPLTCPEFPQRSVASKVVDYSRVLYHAAMEFTDAWSEGGGPRVLRSLKVLP